MKIGVISDTHGLLRPEALQFLAGCGHILHAGDIGKPAILETLAAIAPVSAIRGNNDGQPWASDLPDELSVELEGVRFHLIHDLKTLTLEPSAAGLDVVVSGHSHKPACQRRDGVLYLNPGSIGPRRFRLPITLALLDIDRGRLEGRLLQLAEQGWQPLLAIPPDAVGNAAS